MASTQSKITLPAAKAMILNFRKEGLSYDEIARRLAKAGYVGARGKPLDSFGVGWHVRQSEPKAHIKLAPKEAGPASPDHATAPRKDRFKLALDILNSDLDPALVKDVLLKILS